jgi:hypothetical protein
MLQLRGGMIYEEVHNIFANFGLKQALNLEPGSLDLSGMGEGYYCTILLQQGSKYRYIHNLQTMG